VLVVVTFVIMTFVIMGVIEAVVHRLVRVRL
jgi:hypothetical protein